MSEQKKLQTLAADWRRSNTEFASSGVVLIFQGEVYGWKNEVRDPSCERPGSYAVDCGGQVFLAEGGNDYDGAKCWVVVP